MKRKELIELRQIVQEAKNNRDRINELLKLDAVQEYLTLTDTNESIMGFETDDEIISRIVEDFTILKTNGIYVCTRAYYLDANISDYDTTYYPRNVIINSPKAEYRVYTNIETGKYVLGVISEEKKEFSFNSLFSEFEPKYIVLNPHNTCENQNGYDEVRLDFFKKAIEYGQAKSKKLLLKKYPRL